MHRILLASLLASITACLVGSPDPGPTPGDPGPGSAGSGSGSGSAGSGGTGGSGSGSNGGGGSSSVHPTLVDTDGNGLPDAIDIEPDGILDYQFIEGCGDPRVSSHHDGVIDRLDLDCNGQPDLIVGPTGAVSPAPGANCTVGQHGAGAGGGLGGLSCA